MNAQQWQNFFNSTIDRGLAPAKRIAQSKIDRREEQRLKEQALEDYKAEVRAKMELEPELREVQRVSEAQKLGLPTTATWNEIYEKGRSEIISQNLAGAEYQALLRSADRQAQMKFLKENTRPIEDYYQEGYQMAMQDLNFSGDPRKLNPDYNVVKDILSPEDKALIQRYAYEAYTRDQELLIEQAALQGADAATIRGIAGQVGRPVQPAPMATPKTQEQKPQMSREEFGRKLAQELNQKRETESVESQALRGIVPNVSNALSNYYGARPGPWYRNVAADAATPFAAVLDYPGDLLFGQRAFQEMLGNFQVPEYRPNAKQQRASELMSRVRSGEISMDEAQALYGVQ